MPVLVEDSETFQALRGAGAAGDWWPELLIGLAGEPRFAGALRHATTHPVAIFNQLRQRGSGTDADDQFTPGADAAELLGRVQEILAACKDPRMHLGWCHSVMGHLFPGCRNLWNERQNVLGDLLRHFIVQIFFRVQKQRLRFGTLSSATHCILPF